MSAVEEKILACMAINGLTVQEAIHHCGTTELRSIRCRLEKKGYKFDWIWEDHENGKHKRYFLRGEPNG